MADKLSVYNNALVHLGERRLAGLTEAREPRRVLDDLWSITTDYCLERKFWNFGYRSAQLDASASVTPSFGFTYAFRIPTDWIRTRRLSASEQLTPPLLEVQEESGYWYTNITPIFVQYNSRDVAYGLDLSRWPASFSDYVELRLAARACFRITKSEERLRGPEGLLAREKKAYTVAAANCAMNDPIQFAPPSRWQTARGPGTPGSDFPTGPSLIP